MKFSGDQNRNDSKNNPVVTVIKPPVSVIHTKVLKKISTQVPSLKKGETV